MPANDPGSPNDEDPSAIHAVLDISALLSYARGHVHVGELLIDIADDGGQLGVPSLALLAAHVALQGDERGRAHLGVLCTLPGVAVLPLGNGEAVAVARHVPLAEGDLVRAQVTWAALRNSAYYLTCEPNQVPVEVPPEQIHVIPVEDA